MTLLISFVQTVSSRRLHLTVGLAQYFAFYNAERQHQALGYKTPDDVSRSGVGGALIIDKYGDVAEQTVQPCREQPLEDTPLQRPEKSNTGQRRATAQELADLA